MMRLRHHRNRLRLALTTMVFATVAVSSSPAVSYVFSDECAPKTDHSLNVNAPNTLIVLDKSGSMGQSSSVPGMSLWDTATQAIREVVTALTSPDPDRLRFGLALFCGSAETLVPVKENALSDIDASLTGVTLCSGTNMADGTEQIRGASSLGDPARPSVGIFITDGYPTCISPPCSHSCAKDLIIDSVLDLCEARDRATAPVTSHSIGYGSGTSERLTSLLAAAGGTGSCCNGTTPPCGGMELDVCDMAMDGSLRSMLQDDFDFYGCGSASPQSNLRCEGGIQAPDALTFKNALQEIVDGAACTFPLEIPSMYPEDGALEDPDATDVRISHTTFGPLKLPYCEPSDTDCGLAGVDASLADEGWYFADPNRRYVRLTESLCDAINTSDIDKVTTQVGCICPNVGQTCSGGDGDPDGDGISIDPTLIRCNSGEWKCMNGTEVCVPNGGAMPETCNGLDDDCDGKIDNLGDASTEADWMATSVDPEGKHCNLKNVCVCPGGATDDHAGSDVASYVAAWDPVCECGEGLESATGTSMTPPTTPDDSGAACTVPGPGRRDGTPIAAGFLIFLAGMGLLLRRRS